jgi:hypothetical protein
MSYREVDAAIVARVCKEWLAEHKKEVDAYLARMEQQKWPRVKQTLEDKKLESNDIYSCRVHELLALANCPASMNRIVHLEARDCYILFEIYK